jgi:hypothetical protein
MKHINRDIVKRILLTAACAALLGLAGVVLGGCAKEEEEKQSAPPAAEVITEAEIGSVPLSEGLRGIYADIVSINPLYVIYGEAAFGGKSTAGVVCPCETVKGDTVYVYVKSENAQVQYTGGHNPFRKQYWPAEEAARVKGTVIKADNIAAGLSEQIGSNAWVIVTDEYPEAYEDRADRQEYLNAERSLEADEMEEGFKNVWVDIVSIEPTGYLKSDSETFGGLYTKGIVCRCKTVNGATIRIYADHVDSIPLYGNTNFSKAPKRTYPASAPKRLTGRIVRADTIAENLPDLANGSDLILYISAYPEE